MIRDLVASPAAVCALAAGCIASTALAQCTPAWNTAPGVPGTSSGYVQPMTPWNDGSGTRLYAGGSFASLGGAGPFIAAWNRSTNTWSSLGSGINQGSTNAFVTSILPVNFGSGEELVVGGFFASAGGAADTRSLARWNGSRWAAMGTGWTTATADAVWAVTSWNNRLFVGGGFATIGGVPAANVASTADGSAWTAASTSITGTSPVVFALRPYNDGSGEQLYAAGRFTSLGGTAATYIARYNGSTWSAVGAPFGGTSIFADLVSLAVFDDGTGTALYAGGGSVTLGGQPFSVAKWNGSSWSRVGQALGGRTWALTVWDDGSGPKLYAAGTAQPGVNFIVRLENDTWVTVDGGVNASVFGLNVWDGRLYVGGSFNAVNGQPASGIVERSTCRVACVPDCDGNAVVDINDFFCYLSQYASNDPRADIDGNAVVDINDFFAFLSLYSAGCP